MNIDLIRKIEEERKERNSGAYNNLIRANTELVDKINWIKEDIQRLIDKIIEEDYSKEIVIEELKKIIKNNK